MVKKMAELTKINEVCSDGRILLTIVTISYNQKKYLEKCVESILNEKPSWVEYIVVDGFSRDGSVELLKNTKGVDILIIEKDEGPADALRKAFEVATGKYGMFINSDDLLLPDAYRLIDSELEDKDVADIINFNGIMLDGNGSKIKHIKASVLNKHTVRCKYFVMFQQGLIFKMSLYRKVGGINKNNKTCWDFELLKKMLDVNPIVRMNESEIAAFRLHEESISGGAKAELKTLYLEERKNVVGQRNRGMKESYWNFMLIIKAMTNRIQRK